MSAKNWPDPRPELGPDARSGHPHRERQADERCEPVEELPDELVMEELLRESVAGFEALPDRPPTATQED